MYSPHSEQRHITLTLFLCSVLCPLLQLEKQRLNRKKAALGQ